jgi:hypothetical protein
MLPMMKLREKSETLCRNHITIGGAWPGRNTVSIKRVYAQIVPIDQVVAIRRRIHEPPRP